MNFNVTNELFSNYRMSKKYRRLINNRTKVFCLIFQLFSILKKDTLTLVLRPRLLKSIETERDILF